MPVRCLFLQGKSGVGKSTLLLRCLKPHIYDIGGFYVQRLIEAGKTVGFCIQPVTPKLIPEINAAKGKEAESGIFIAKTRLGIKMDAGVFSKKGASYISPAAISGKKIILMDEIGGIELLSEKFLTCLYKVLSGALPCIGIFKSKENSVNLNINVLNGNELYRKRYKVLADDITSRFNGEIITVTEKNRYLTESKIAEFLNNIYLNPV